MNRLVLKALLLSVITEIKHSMPLSKHAINTKREYKRLRGLRSNISNVDLLKDLCKLYCENGIGEEFKNTIYKYKLVHLFYD